MSQYKTLFMLYAMRQFNNSTLSTGGLDTGQKILAQLHSLYASL